MGRYTRLNLLLLATCALMGSGLYSAMSRVPEQALVGVAEPERAPPPARLLRFDPGAANRFGAITDRPLFMQTRRPVERVQKPVVQVPPPGLRITGMFTVGADRQAMVRIDAGPTETLRMNDRVGDWRVSAMTDQTVTLSLRQRSIVYRLGEEPPEDSAPGAVRRDRPAPAASFDMSEQIDE